MSSNSTQGGSLWCCYGRKLPKLPREKIDVVVKRTFIDMPVRTPSSSNGPAKVRRASLPARLDRVSPRGELAKFVASRSSRASSGISEISTQHATEGWMEWDATEDEQDECESKACDGQIIAPHATYSNVAMTQWPTCPYPPQPQPQILSTTFSPVQSPKRRPQPAPANYEDPWQPINNMIDSSASPRRRAPTTGSYHSHLQSLGNAVLDNSSSPRRRAPAAHAGYDNQRQPYRGNTTIEGSMSPQRRRPLGVGAQMRWQGQPTAISSADQSMSPQRRTALSSKAQAWQPTPPAQNPRFNNQAADVMAKLEVALLSGEWDLDLVIKKDANNFTVSVAMKEEEVKNWPLVVEEAQEVLLRAAKESSCVYVLGYENEPFKKLENGFMATLGEMKDEAVACWDTYALGACHQGAACTKAHPQSSACVVLQLVD